MTPREKAQSLIDSMAGFALDDCIRNAKIVCDEVLEELMFFDTLYASQQNKFWNEVKQEINNIETHDNDNNSI